MSTARTGSLKINSSSTSTNTLYLGSIGTTTYIDGNVLTLGSTSSTIRLGATQASGTIEIATDATRTGALFINSTTGATNSVYLGASGTTTIIDGNTLKLGSASTATTNTNTFTSTGLITANGGLTIPSGKTLTANGGIVSSTVDTATGGTMAIGASSTGGITIGAVNAPTTIAGLLTADGGLKLNAGDLITANGGLTLGGAYGITLTTTSYSPISTQLGYIGRAYNQNTVNYSTGTVGSDIVNTGTVLAIGIYQMMWTVSVNNWTNGTSAYMNFSFNTSGAISMYGVPQTSGNLPPTSGSDFIMQLQGVTNSNTQFATFNFSCIVKSTLASQEINFRGKINTGTNTATTPPGYAQVTWIKIA